MFNTVYLSDVKTPLKRYGSGFITEYACFGLYSIARKTNHWLAYLVLEANGVSVTCLEMLIPCILVYS